MMNKREFMMMAAAAPATMVVPTAASSEPPAMGRMSRPNEWSALEVPAGRYGTFRCAYKLIIGEKWNPIAYYTTRNSHLYFKFSFTPEFARDFEDLYTDDLLTSVVPTLLVHQIEADRISVGARLKAFMPIRCKAKEFGFVREASILCEEVPNATGLQRIVLKVDRRPSRLLEEPISYRAVTT